MYIPPADLYSPLQPRTDVWDIGFFKGAKGGITPEKWSSLIGIITAICGNILISFALNTQRYAHMRLSRDREEWELKQRRERKNNRNTSQSYGTQQGEGAEQRAETNRDGRTSKYTLEVRKISHVSFAERKGALETTTTLEPLGNCRLNLSVRQIGSS